MPLLLHAAVLETDGYIVGSANARSGLFRREPSGAWTHLGWRNGRPFGLAADPDDPARLYLACGNGVLRSADAGRTWRVTTDWRITEVLAVAVLPDAPRTLVAATAHGLHASPDRGDTWRPAEAGGSGFVAAVCADRRGGGRILAGSETGLRRSTDGGDTWQPVGPPELPVRALVQHPIDPDTWTAATEDHGLWTSADEGRTWRPGGPAPGATFYSVACAGDALAAAGFRTGVHVRRGGLWSRFSTPDSDASVHALAFDPEDPDTLWIGIVRTGLFRIDLRTGAWTPAGLPGATIYALAFLPAQTPGGSPSPATSSAWKRTVTEQAASDRTGQTPGVALPPPPLLAHPEGSTYAARCEALVDYFADRQPGDYLDWIGYIEIAARLVRGRHTEAALARLDELLDAPFGDMFWMLPAALLTVLGDRLPAPHRRRLRDAWRTYTPYRGDTENHWAMYYAALYLTAQSDPGSSPGQAPGSLNPVQGKLSPGQAPASRPGQSPASRPGQSPDAPASAWFNGRSAHENIREAEDYLFHWIDLTLEAGQGEFDSPHYLPFFLAPLALLYGWADDPAMRTRAGMMLDLLIADFAVNTLDGLYAGAFSRIYPEPLLERWRNGSTTFAWLLFGNTPFRPDAVNVLLPWPGYRPHGAALMLALSGYAPPEVVVRMATDRPAPFLHRARKRTRHRIRYSPVRNAPVYKTAYVDPAYAVGSIQGGLLQPIQQHTWEVMWQTDDPHAGDNVLFTLHPYAGPLELGMYFPEEPKLMTEAVVKSRKETYDSPDKWTGGSPFEQIHQERDAVVALYALPPETRFPHISGFFSHRLDDLHEDDSGWLFMRAGEARIAYYPLAPFAWRAAERGSRRLHSDVLRNGAVVQVAPLSAHASMRAFADAVRALPLEVRLDPVPSVRFTTRHGDRLAVTYGKTPVVNGAEVDYDAWPLYDGPFLSGVPGSRIVDLRHGDLHRRLDFGAAG